MIDMADNIYSNKYAIKCALGIIKSLRKLDKIKEEEIMRFEPLFMEYKNSAEYKKLVEELAKKDEDDDFKSDADPKGFDHYNACVSYLDFAKFLVVKPHEESL